MTSSISVERIGKFDYLTDRENKDDYKTEYVSRITFRNAGKTIFGGTPYYQEIEFSNPQSIDELIAILVYAKTDLMADKDWSCKAKEAIERCNNEFKSEETENGIQCGCCGEVTSVKYGEIHDGEYDQKPKRCASCGAFIEETYWEG